MFTGLLIDAFYFQMPKSPVVVCALNSRRMGEHSRHNVQNHHKKFKTQLSCTCRLLQFSFLGDIFMGFYKNIMELS